MKKIFSLFLLIVFLNVYTPVLAASIEVREGTRVPITVTSEYTSKTIESGQRINAIIEDDVKINNVIVFKKGDNAILNISDVKKAGFVGMSGMMEIVNGSVTDIHGEKHSIDFEQTIVGEEKNWPKACVGLGVITVVLIPLALFGFVRGGQAKISPSKVIEVSIRNNFEFVPEKL